MIFAGIDIGYGYTKVIYENENGNINGGFSFKTTVEPYVKTDKVFGLPLKVVKVNNNSFLVGKDAAPNWTVSKDFVGTDMYYAIIGRCLDKIKRTTGQTVTHVGLGLPPSMFNERRISLIKNTIERMEIKVNDEVVPLPQYIFFLPQGVGVFLDFINQKPEFKNKNVVVIDIGYYTIDMTFFREGNFIIQASKSYPSGVEVMYEKIIEEFTNKYGDFANVNIAETLLKTGSFTYFGKQYSFDAKNILINFYIPEVLSKVKDYATYLKNKNYEITDINAFICAGGGSIYLKDLISGLEFIEEPNMSNARGYKNYAKRNAM